MCGIFGYYNFRVSRDRQAILELLFTGLRRLEYRGYDSAGISIDADDLLQQAVVGQPGYGHSNGAVNGNVAAAGNGSGADGADALGRVFR